MSKALKASGKTPEEIAYRVLPSFFLEIIEKYLRVKTEGLDYLPKSGPAIVIANHSGYMGFDALMLGYEIYKNTGRIPRVIAHKLWFVRPEISVHAEKMGMIPATYDNGKEILEKGEILLLFPEGEEGNFKPTRYRYKLRKFRRGFARLAMATGAPIIPAVVIGAEETHITLSQIRWAKELFGVVIPLPLNVIPLPAKWKIKFYAPRPLKVPEKVPEDFKVLNQVTQKYRSLMQHKLDTQLKKRSTIFI